jgi:hypothetical protein
MIGVKKIRDFNIADVYAPTFQGWRGVLIIMCVAAAEAQDLSLPHQVAALSACTFIGVDNWIQQSARRRKVLHGSMGTDEADKTCISPGMEKEER